MNAAGRLRACESLTAAPVKLNPQSPGPIAWNWNTEQEKPPIQMCTAWIMPYIFVSGHVIPCCVGNEANQRELQKKLSLGNVNDRSFKEIWDSPEYKEFRAMIRRGETPLQCRDCGVFAVDRGKQEMMDERTGSPLEC